MRLALESTDGVEKVTLLPSFGTGKVMADPSVTSEQLLEIINAEDVSAQPA